MTRLEQRERLLRDVSESDWTNQVVKLAKTFGWRVHHSRTAWSASGRPMTPLQGHPGLPDLILVRPPRVIFAELKRQNVKVVAYSEQEAWLAYLRECPGVETYVWRPGDIEEVATVLSGRPATLKEDGNGSSHGTRARPDGNPPRKRGSARRELDAAASAGGEGF